MAELRAHRPVLLVLAAFSRHEDALDWACDRAAQTWGGIVLSSPRLPFDATRYYEATMGGGLMKVLLAMQQLIDPATLVEIKHQAIQWEAEYQQTHPRPEPRPLNLDPGYVTEAKLVLASTKDRDHRLYLGHGIFGEVTIYYQRGSWRCHSWTYPDYRSPEYHQFFANCRDYLRQTYSRKN